MRGARQAAAVRRAGDGDRPRRPRDRRRHGAARRLAGEGPVGRGARREGWTAWRRRSSRSGPWRRAAPGRAPTVSGHLVHVRVDPETGQVRVLGYVLAQDVGHALNPALVEGQLDGRRDPGHRLGAARAAPLRRAGPAADAARSWTTRCRRRRTCPTIETILVEVPAPDGPFGAKGVGEAPVCGSTGAIANAVAAAAGADATRCR